MFARVASSAVLLVFVLLWTGITVAIDLLATANMVRQVQAERWPSVPGTITRSEVEAVRSSKGGTTYGPKVAYRYSVDGQRYEGGTDRSAAWRTSNPRDAERQVARFPIGATVPVYYQPGKPSETVLQPGLRSTDLFVLMILLPFNLVALWLGALVGWALMPEPPLVSPFVREDGSEGVTLERQSMLSWVFLAMGGSALACVVIAGIAGGLNAPLPVGMGAWGVVIACGVLAGRWVRARRKAGHYDLRIHAQAKSLSLPPFSGREHRLDLRWRDTRSLRVEPRVHERKGRKETRYALAIEYATTDGLEQQTDIASFTRQEQAEALADWLGARLPHLDRPSRAA
ncbi:DUF3592 domain-containing protein [Corallococcus aberystwythensis]|uniref:DUF3592 domain-containing protein n=1 Tax=Corallococcus aberystwythensis TaxID=2316722 RepID=A0A3A8R814_9BACT|nr:DUF3592 domain-containing protein [Corallococcus aberystwythensis]RKH73412.1 DUF3592 domain-containing protein [Corallococcus aberystwythensis]